MLYIVVAVVFAGVWINVGVFPQVLNTFDCFRFSDYVIEEKTAVLQKRESEGFGFVLRGAKGTSPWQPWETGRRTKSFMNKVL